MSKVHRFVFMNEPSEAVKKLSAIKMICDGEINCQKMYKVGNHKSTFTAKLFVATNELLHVANEGDTGVGRRVQMYYSTNRFVKEHQKHLVNNTTVMPIPRRSSTLSLFAFTVRLSAFSFSISEAASVEEDVLIIQGSSSK